jgi:quinoprotein glucose dehydrogenase
VRLNLVRTRYWLTPLVFLSILAAAPRSARDGVYSKAQATRGKALYEEECSKCHGINLGGGDGSPELAGAAFMDRWKGKSVGALFTYMKKTMPTDDPGHLANRQYADLVAYLLSSNEYPAGTADLDPSSPALNEITLDAKP